MVSRSVDFYWVLKKDSLFWWLHADLFGTVFPTAFMILCKKSHRSRLAGLNGGSVASYRMNVGLENGEILSIIDTSII